MPTHPSAAVDTPATAGVARHDEHDFRLPRSFWRGRLLRLTGLLLVAVLLLRLGVGRHLANRTRAADAAARARGEPTSLAEVALPTVPNADNAWVAQMAAAALAVPGVDSPRTSNLVYSEAPPYGPNWTALASGSERAHGPLFAAARQARALPRAAVRSQLNLTALLGLTPGWNQSRNLANLLADGATWAHLQGDDAEAVERLRDALYVGRSLRQDPTLISQLVGMGVEALTCHGTMVIAPGLRPGAADPGSSAARAGVRGLIAELLDESAARAGLPAALTVERLAGAEQVRAEGEKTWAIRPLAEAEVTRATTNGTLAADAARAASWPNAQAVLRREAYEPVPSGGSPGGGGGRAAPPEVPRYSRWFQTSGRSLARSVKLQFRGLGERRMAATSLAAQLYRADHGRWPDRLQDLVPDYLPAVPADPFAADGRPLGYVVKSSALPGGADRPLVYYEEGPQDTDPNPQGETPFWDEPKYSWYGGLVGGRRNEAVRQYRDLTRFRLPGVPAVDDASGMTTPPTLAPAGPATPASGPASAPAATAEPR
ncbi:MAG: hypothetical protein JWO31_4136 [Phycisphaerales bacterium]|nr:hypothetical protein [Phycisphaerales bacterium]